MSAKFPIFLTLSRPCLHFHATSLTKLPYCICFWGTPSPLPVQTSYVHDPSTESSAKGGKCFRWSRADEQTNGMAQILTGRSLQREKEVEGRKCSAPFACATHISLPETIFGSVKNGWHGISGSFYSYRPSLSVQLGDFKLHLFTRRCRNNKQTLYPVSHALMGLDFV